MRIILLATVTFTACSSQAETMASLRTESEHGTYLVEVKREIGGGYPVRFQCIEKCPYPVDFVEQLGDHPQGLFSRDYQDDLIFYLSSSGSALQVRAWQISDQGVRRVAQLSSRGRPDFLSDANGHAVIQTYERGHGAQPLIPVRWKFADGRFERITANVR